MTRAVLGVDPGLSGAVAVLTMPHNAINVRDVPTFEVGKKRRLDIHQLDRIIGELILLHEPAFAVVEDVHSMPLQGVVSSFTFGFVAGATQAILAARRVPIRLVQPGVWKRMLGLSRDKDHSRQLASRLFPNHSDLWPLKKHDGRAESALLAYYGTMSA